MHPVKRRRLDAANTALARPFRSPLHVGSSRKSTPPSDILTGNDQTIQASDTTSSNSPLTETAQASSPPPHRPYSSPLRHHKKLHPTSPSSPIRPTRPSRPSQDALYLALQKQHSALTLQLKDLSHSLDTATQALRYTLASTNNDLPALIIKWQAISRDCAEELFITARDRVNKMGGMGAWREKFDTKNQNNNSWGMGDNQEIDEDHLTDEQKEQLDYMREEAVKEAQKYGLDRAEEEVKQEKDDDTFTMDMMLKQLNVDLDLIGYDKTAQRWAD